MNGIYEVCGVCAALTTDMQKHMSWHTTTQTTGVTVTVKPSSTR